MEFLNSILLASWHILLDAAPFMLFGFLVAGLMRVFVPSSLVARHLGKNGPASVLKAAVLGAPLPLCSCSVLPAAAGLKRQGAGKGATASFLVATPETGVDSIAVSYALLDPFMTAIRPFAGVLTAVMAGLGINFFERNHDPQAEALSLTSAAQEEFVAGCGCSPGSCSSTATSEKDPSQSLWGRVWNGIFNAVSDLLADIGGWFLAGVLLAGVITALLPDGALGSWLGSGPLAMLAALAVAIPLYVCATASTPLAAALVLKGLSPGAALVFLLAGPATNAATLAVVARLLGRRSAVIYLASIVIASLALGMVADWAYAHFGLSTAGWLSGGLEETFGIFSKISAVVLLALIPLGTWRERRKHGREQGNAEQSQGSGRENCCEL